MIVKLVRKALSYNVALVLPVAFAACAHAPERPIAEGVRVAETSLPANEVRNYYYSDDSFTTRVGEVIRSCVPGPILHLGKTSEYYVQYDQPCSLPPHGGTTYRCVDGFCQEI